MPAEPEPRRPKPVTKRQLDKFTQPAWAIEVVGTWDEETQSIVPLTKAERERLRPKTGQ